MLVFNLTNQPVVYRGRTLPPEGSFDYKDMSYIPTRDQDLAKAKILSFGARPAGWKSAKPAAMTTVQVASIASKVTPIAHAASPEVVKVDEKLDIGMKKKKY